MFADTLTSVHTLLSFAAILLGFAALPAWLGHGGRRRWTPAFLAVAILVTATGFLFPFVGVTPAFVTGIVASAIFVAVLVARFGSSRHPRIEAVGLVASLYLLVFVLIAQLFAKVPALTALAPTGSEPPFAIVQAICLAAFVWLGWRAWRVHGPLPPVAGATG
jgi:hypothetical protein